MRLIPKLCDQCSSWHFATATAHFVQVDELQGSTYLPLTRSRQPHGVEHQTGKLPLQLHNYISHRRIVDEVLKLERIFLQIVKLPFSRMLYPMDEFEPAGAHCPVGG